MFIHIISLVAVQLLLNFNKIYTSSTQTVNYALLQNEAGLHTGKYTALFFGSKHELASQICKHMKEIKWKQPAL